MGVRKALSYVAVGEAPIVKGINSTSPQAGEDGSHSAGPPHMLLHVLASGSAGAVSRFTTHPLDTIKTHMMIDRSGGGAGSQSIWAVGRGIVRSEGVRGLYSGVTLAMAVTAPALSLFLTSYDVAKATLVAHGWSPDSLLVHVQAGTAAEVVSGALWTPMEVIKQKLQAQSASNEKVYSGAIHGIREVLKSEGLRGLYRGYLLTLSVYIPQTTIFFVLYERLKRAAAAAATCPFEVIKTRWQVQRGGSSAQGNHAWMGLDYRNPSHVVTSVIAEEGVRGLFKGVVARVLWVAPSIAVSMSCYEAFKRWSQRRQASAP